MSDLICTQFKEMNKGSLLGFANIYIPKWGIEVYGISLFQKGDRKWVSFPSREYEKDGEKKYLSHLKFRERGHMDLFGERVIKAVELFKGSQETEEVQEIIPF